MNDQIFNIITECNYSNNNKDYIGMIILELYNLDNKTAFYKVIRNNNKIIVAHYKIKVNFKSKIYDVPLLIYIPIDFPKTPPEIYIENQNDIGVNPRNRDIDQSTKKITLGSLRSWNVYSTISVVLDEIKKSFNNDFPIYKRNSVNTGNLTNDNNNSSNYYNNNFYNNNNNNINNNNNNIYNNNFGNNSYNNYNNSNNNSSYVSNSMYNNYYKNNNSYSNTSSVNYTDYMNYNNNYKNNYNNINNNNNNNNSNNNNSNSNNNNNNFNNTTSNFNNNNSNTLNNNTNILGYNNRNSTHYDGEIKKKLIEELKKQLEPKLKEEIISIKKQEDVFSNYKKEFLALSNSLLNTSDKKNEAIELLNNYIISINDDINFLNNHIQKLKDSNLNENNYQEFIEYDNKELIKACCIEATLEDISSIIKKAFDRGIFSYEESLKYIREITKEIIKVRYYKERLANINIK